MRKWLKEYLKDQEAPTLVGEGTDRQKEVQRHTEREFKQMMKANTKTLPTGLSFQELNSGRVLTGDLPHDVAGTHIGVGKTRGVGDDGKLPDIETLIQSK